VQRRPVVAAPIAELLFAPQIDPLHAASPWMAPLGEPNQGMEAMKKTTFAAALIALAGVNLAGCKTTPKMSWWKTAKAPESTAVAHTAPALPSDLAKSSSSAAASTAASGGGDAAPFVSSQASRTSTAPATGTASPAGYPSTDAPPFTPAVASQIASSTASGAGAPSVQNNSASLGNIAASPYNPLAVPPRATSTPGGMDGNPAIPESRYPSSTASTAPLYGQPVASVTPSTSGIGRSIPGMPTYGAAAGSAPQVAAAGQTGGVTTSNPADIAGRYSAEVGGAVDAGTGRYGQIVDSAAQAANGAVNSVAGAMNGATGAVQQATSQVATGQSYRPGGTGTYPTVPLEVAAVPSSAPHVARPGDATTPSGTNSPSAPAPTQYR
jgi:hypothetical protein